MIKIKSHSEIENMKAAGRIVAETFELLKEAVKPGVSTFELDEIAAKFIKKSGAIASFKN